MISTIPQEILAIAPRQLDTQSKNLNTVLPTKAMVTTERYTLAPPNMSSRVLQDIPLPIGTEGTNSTAVINIKVPIIAKNNTVTENEILSVTKSAIGMFSITLVDILTKIPEIVPGVRLPSIDVVVIAKVTDIHIGRRKVGSTWVTSNTAKPEASTDTTPSSANNFSVSSTIPPWPTFENNKGAIGVEVVIINVKISIA